MTSSEYAITLNSPEQPTDVASSDGTERESFRSVFMFAVMLVLAGLLAYENSFAGVFHFDDVPCIVTNHSLKSLSDTWNATAEEIPGGLRRRNVGRWTFAFNRSLHDLDLWGYHAVNLAIHVAAALFLMGLVRRTMLLPNMPTQIQRHATTLAFCVALLWVVHPIQTESVTYIVQRLESLMGMFFIAARSPVRAVGICFRSLRRGCSCPSFCVARRQLRPNPCLTIAFASRLQIRNTELYSRIVSSFPLVGNIIGVRVEFQ